MVGAFVTPILVAAAFVGAIFLRPLSFFGNEAQILGFPENEAKRGLTNKGFSTNSVFFQRIHIVSLYDQNLSIYFL